MELKSKLEKLRLFLNENKMEIEIGSYGLIIRDEDNSYVSDSPIINPEKLEVIDEIAIVQG